MNKNINILIGAAVGGSIGWFVGAVIAEVIAIKCDGYGGESPIEDDEESEEEFNVLERNQKKLKTEKKKTKDYTKSFKSLEELASKYGHKSEETSEDIVDADHVIEDEFAEPEEVDDTPKDIQIISLADFANDQYGFEAITLNYYDDDVVTDEHDQPINRPEQILGDEALVSFGELSEDEDVVYVRNMLKKAIYEVVRLNKVYASSPSRSRRRDRIDKMGEEEGYGEEVNSA